MTGINVGKTRYMWVDYVKGICMCVVIFNHLYVPDIYYRFTYPFELVGFFFVSGYTFSTKSNFKTFIFNKLSSLAFPIISLGLINYFFSWLVKGTNIWDYVSGLVLQIPGRWDDLWFVACLFIMELLFYFILKVIPSNLYRFLACILISFIGYYLFVRNVYILYPWHIQNACIFVPYMFAGYFCGQAYRGQLIFRFLTKVQPWKTLTVVVLCHAIVVLFYDNSHVDVHLLQFGNFIMFYISAMTGLSVIVCLAVMLELCRNKTLMKSLSFIGANTLVYYAFQSKMISGLIALTAQFGIQYWPYISSIIYGIIVCCLLSIPTYVIKRFFPFLLNPRLMNGFGVK